MSIKIFSLDYFKLIMIVGIVIFLFFYLTKNNEKKTNRKILLILSLINTGLFFLKILIPPFSNILFKNSVSNYPYSLVYLTFSNICAVSTLLLPLVFIIKNKIIKDCINLIALIGGLLAIVIPVSTFYKIPSLDFVRFIIQHVLLIIIPLYMYIYKIEELQFKSFIFVPIYFLVVELIILINNEILLAIGLIPSRIELYLFYNDSFIYGPYTDPNKPWKFITIFIPKFLRNSMYEGTYIPFIYLIIPTIIYLSPISFLTFKLLFINKKKIK